MLQVLHLDISKLEMFAQIAMVFQLYIANVSSILDICCKDFDQHVAVLDGATSSTIFDVTPKKFRTKQGLSLGFLLKFMIEEIYLDQSYYLHWIQYHARKWLF
jgi:hypothetical protein